MSAKSDPREFRAKMALERAMNGELWDGGKYSLQVPRGNRYKTCLPKQPLDNMGLRKGAEGSVFVDLDNQAVIICYGDRDE